MTVELEIQRPYRHYKGSLYYVHYIATNTETEEQLVIYQALYEPFGMYSRSLEMFLERVDCKREDNITHQEYRFELYKGI